MVYFKNDAEKRETFKILISFKYIYISDKVLKHPDSHPTQSTGDYCQCKICCSQYLTLIFLNFLYVYSQFNLHLTCQVQFCIHLFAFFLLYIEEAIIQLCVWKGHLHYWCFYAKLSPQLSLNETNCAKSIKQNSLSFGAVDIFMEM